MVTVQIFGVKNSQATRAAERFFKERRATIHMVDLNQKAVSACAIQLFIERLGVSALLDTAGAAYVDECLKYITLSEAELLGKIEREPRLLLMPLVRSRKHLTLG